MKWKWVQYAYKPRSTKDLRLTCTLTVCLPRWLVDFVVKNLTSKIHVDMWRTYDNIKKQDRKFCQWKKCLYQKSMKDFCN